MADRKFIKGIFESQHIELGAFPALGTKAVITTALNAAMTALGLPNAVSLNTVSEGFVVGSLNRVEVMASTGEFFFDPGNNRVYGRLVQNGTDMEVEFYSFDGTAESAYDFGAAPVNLDMLLPYRFEYFREYLVDAALRRAKFQVGDKTVTTGSKTTSEILTIVTQNTLPALTTTPEPGSVELVFGDIVTKTERAADFTVAGQTITVVPGTLGFNVDPGDKVLARYNIAE